MSNGKNREAAEKGCFNNRLHDMTGAEGGGRPASRPALSPSLPPAAWLLMWSSTRS